jgi:FixJ family two-component response regulator
MNDGDVVVHLIDDDQMFRRALAAMLEAAGYAVKQYASAGEFLLQDAPRAPGCIILDLQLPGPSGLDLHEALAHRCDSLPVVFLSGYGDVPTTARAMKAGAVDFLTKPVQRDTMLAAVQAAVRRDVDRRTKERQKRDVQSRFTSLSAREAQIFWSIVDGKVNKQIARDLNIAERTVKTYRAQVMSKMRARSVAELARMATELETVDARSGQAARA